MQISEVDPRDGELLRAWHDTYATAASHERPYAVPWQYEEIRAELLEPGLRRRYSVHAGVVDGEMVAVGELSLPQLDNTTSASLNLGTRPGRRRHGYGAAMLEHLEALAGAAGRTLLNAEISYPYDASTSADLDFATRRGYVVGIGDVMRVLDLPADDESLDRLAAEAAPHHEAYELRSYEGPLPDDVVGSFAALNALLEVEAPTGELEKEAMSPDVAALREEERVRTAQGRSWTTTLALQGDEVVALTVMGTSVHEPHRCYQWGTLVSRAHRGHRLGAAVKVANLRAFAREHPAARTVFTWNAEVNSHMVGINEQLGFRPVERLAELQKRTGGPRPATTPPAAPPS
ncbi:GNAT family N-acetyltransferase [Nocardioides mangrovicus]|uniref:GNAT family N-acetyltransferase n=1 Tax=Nocardioides mangrovicus TaxID=2478913 RepID=A0A3L8P7F7_9ACTN|nr:GNAT family N-acetyltransferase [Nocardioides mangrovicus]RLV50683.1 GNAT family N-acetyltransferase [Nocardioides mangrovicus]